MGSAAACSNDRSDGLGHTKAAAPEAAAYSANEPRAEAEHLVLTGPQPAHVRHRRPPRRRPRRRPTIRSFGRVRPETPIRRGVPRVAAQHVPVVGVERGGAHPDQHVVGTDPRQLGRPRTGACPAGRTCPGRWPSSDLLGYPTGGGRTGRRPVVGERRISRSATARLMAQPAPHEQERLGGGPAAAPTTAVPDAEGEHLRAGAQSEGVSRAASRHGAGGDRGAGPRGRRE